MSVFGLKFCRGFLVWFKKGGFWNLFLGKIKRSDFFWVKTAHFRFFSHLRSILAIFGHFRHFSLFCITFAEAPCKSPEKRRSSPRKVGR